jgi:neutral ceramidase
MNGLFCSLLSVILAAQPAEFKAGVGRVKITPDGPIAMSGYAVRVKPSEGVEHDLWTKALALESEPGRPVVIVAADVICLPRAVVEEVAGRVKKTRGLERRQILFNASHTHSGPVILSSLENLVPPNADHKQLLEYRNRLTDALIDVIEAALDDLKPAVMSVGHGSAGFAINRRMKTNKGVQSGVNPDSPVDHDVPVLRIAAPDGRVRAVLFGYACHNTTLTGENLLIGGDYAGFAQIELERALPGATAIFMQLCGADQNPQPRGQMDHARQHGKTLADAVQKAISGEMKTVQPTIRTNYETLKLDFVRRERSVYEAEAKSEDQFRRNRAEAMLKAIDENLPVWQLDLPVQVVHLSDKLALVGIGGEVVVDYVLRLKRECPGMDLIVAGYCNDVPCYIPSRRILGEGGYEADQSMIYYKHPGPLAENVEEVIIGACRRLLEK